MKEQILKLRSEGLSYRQIEKKLGCSRSLINYYLAPGAKEKSNERQRGYRKNRKERILYEKVRKISMSVANFRRRDGSKNGKTTHFYSGEEVLAKIGADPVCYLTGRKIDLFDSGSYNFDHVLPPSKGGDNDISNFGICIKEANIAKQDMTIDEFLSFCLEVLRHNGYKITRA